MNILYIPELLLQSELETNYRNYQSGLKQPSVGSWIDMFPLGLVADSKELALRRGEDAASKAARPASQVRICSFPMRRSEMANVVGTDGRDVLWGHLWT